MGLAEYMHARGTLGKEKGTKESGWLPFASVLASVLLSSRMGWAQQGPPLPLARLAVVRDSLEHLLATDHRPDTLRVVRLNTLAFALRTNDAPQAQRLAQQGLRLAQQLGFERGLVEAHFNVGYNYRVRSQYDSAIYHSQQALAGAIRTGQLRRRPRSQPRRTGPSPRHRQRPGRTTATSAGGAHRVGTGRVCYCPHLRSPSPPSGAHGTRPAGHGLRVPGPR
nr:hypothetical protein [Tanacetum cinerariifolium]